MDDPIEVITAAELIAYPGAGAPSQDDADYYVDLVNGLITEGWANPIDPVPFWVKLIALESAARASRNPRALESWTRSIDDGSRTERVSKADLERTGIYLTPADQARLAGKSRRRQRYGTIRVGIGY